MIEQCCNGDTAYLLLQINVICLLLALIGAAAIIKHPGWFGGMPASTTQTIAER
jgi:phosphate/sulfate permease